jgi:hypothetical protein
LLARVGINPTLRAEEVKIADFIALARALDGLPRQENAFTP